MPDSPRSPLFGFINCNKPRGMSSRDVVNVVQRRLRQNPETKKVKVGHCGTLDPLAEGVLVLGVGAAVRLVPYMQQHSKRYLGRFLLGQSSPTGDLEMETTRHDHFPEPPLVELEKQAAKLVGRIEQVPPAYSAIWVDGKRAYERVRRGEDVEVPSRTVTIESLRIVGYEYPELTLDIVCGSGTYIRTLGMDLAKAAGSCSVMSFLQRTAVGPAEVAGAVSIDQLRHEDLESMLLPAAIAVGHLPTMIVDDAMSQRLGNGLCVDGAPAPPAGPDDDVAAMTQTGLLRAILRRKRGQWCPYRVFNVETEREH